MSDDYTPRKIEFGDYLSAVNFTKEPLMDDDPTGDIEKKYPAFIANRLFSYHPDMIYAVALMNQYSALPNKMQFDFYRLTTHKKKRWSKLAKEEKDTHAKLSLISDYYNVSHGKAREILHVLTDSQYEELVDGEANKGGRK